MIYDGMDCRTALINTSLPVLDSVFSPHPFILFHIRSRMTLKICCLDPKAHLNIYQAYRPPKLPVCYVAQTQIRGRGDTRIRRRGDGISKKLRYENVGDMCNY